MIHLRFSLASHIMARHGRISAFNARHSEARRGLKMARIIANVPVLPGRELEPSSTFCARLGYRTIHSYQDYLSLSCDGGELHLAGMTVDPGQNPAGLYLRVSGVN